MHLCSDIANSFQIKACCLRQQWQLSPVELDDCSNTLGTDTELGPSQGKLPADFFILFFDDEISSRQKSAQSNLKFI